jgi:hypothetical protein
MSRWPLTISMRRATSVSMAIENPIAVRWVSSVRDAPRQDWQACFQPPVEGWWWYDALEKSRLEAQFKFSYGLVESAGRLLAIAPAFVMDVPIDMVAPPLVAKVLRAAGAVVRRLRYQRTFFIGSACSDEGTVGLSPGVAFSDVAGAIQAAALVRAKEAGASIVVWKDFPPVCGEALEGVGMFRVVSFPGTCVALPRGGFEAYLKSLKADRRHDLKRHLKRGEKIGPLVESVIQRPDEATLEEIFGLFWQTYEKGKTKFERLTPEFFRQIAAADVSHFALLRHPDGGKLAAFMLCFNLGSRVINKFIGLDYTLGPEWFLYFRLWKVAVEWTSSIGATELQNGQTGYRPKLGLGCVLEPLNNYCRHRNPLLNRVFARVGGSTTLADLDGDLGVHLKKHPELAGADSD